MVKRLFLSVLFSVLVSNGCFAGPCKKKAIALVGVSGVLMWGSGKLDKVARECKERFEKLPGVCDEARGLSAEDLKKHKLSGCQACRQEWSKLESCEREMKLFNRLGLGCRVGVMVSAFWAGCEFKK